MPELTSELRAALATLIDAGAVIALVGGKGGKAPVAEWKHPDDDARYVVRGLDEVQAHLRRRATSTFFPWVGLFPESVGLVAVDYDGGGEANQRAWLGVMPEPVYVGRSKSGSHHAWYRHPKGRCEGVRSGEMSFEFPRLDGVPAQAGVEVDRTDRAVDGQVFQGNHQMVMWGADYVVGLAAALTAGTGSVWEGELAELFRRCTVGAGRKTRYVRGLLSGKEPKRVTLPEALRVLVESTGARDNTFTQVVASVVQGELREVDLRPEGVIGRALVRAVCAAGGPDDVRAKAMKDYGRALGRRAERQAVVEREVAEQVGDRVELTGGPSMDTVREALAGTDWEFRHDELRRERQVRFGADAEWEALTDDALTRIRREFDERYYYFPRDRKGQRLPWRPYCLPNSTMHLWPVVMGESDAARTNPLGEWLARCEREAEGADEALLDEWLGRLFVISDSLPSEALAWVSRRLVCASAARLMRPGTAWPRMVILQGPQAVGKSLLVREMLPPGEEWDGYHTDELHLGMRDAQMIYCVRGKAWVECAEMKGRAREIEDMRTFVTRTVDGSGERLAYRRDPEPYPRTCVLIGTANHADCIPRDPYGSRRYFVVPVEASRCREGRGPSAGRLVREVMGELRNRLYGLAVRVLRRDAEATGRWGSMLLDEAGLGDVFEAAAHAHREVDEWEEPMREFVGRWGEHYNELGGYFHSQEIAEYCRVVGLEPGQVEYQSYATSARRWHGRVREILTGKDFGLVLTSRWAPGLTGNQWGWWRAEHDISGMPASRVELTREERRERLGIPSPRELREEAQAASSAGTLR